MFLAQERVGNPVGQNTFRACYSLFVHRSTPPRPSPPLGKFTYITYYVESERERERERERVRVCARVSERNQKVWKSGVNRTKKINVSTLSSLV